MLQFVKEIHINQAIYKSSEEARQNLSKLYLQEETSLVLVEAQTCVRDTRQ